MTGYRRLHDLAEDATTSSICQQVSARGHLVTVNDNYL
jgi:CHASE3 domain sensor protein